MRIFKSIITAGTRTISYSPCALYKLSTSNQWELNDQRNKHRNGRGEGMRRGKQQPNFQKRGLGKTWLCYKLPYPTELRERGEQRSSQFPAPNFQCLVPFWWNHHLHLIMLLIIGSWKATETGEQSPLSQHKEIPARWSPNSWATRELQSPNHLICFFLQRAATPINGSTISASEKGIR